MSTPSPEPQAQASPSPASPSVTIGVPDLQTLMGLGGAGSLSTTTADVWGTGNYGTMSVVTGRGADDTQYRGMKSQTYSPPDETATVNDVLAAGYKLSSSDLTQLQQKLWLAGMYQGTGVSVIGQIPFGQYDENTIQAYANLLKLNASQQARGQNTVIDDTLSGLIKQQTQINANQAGKSNTDISLSDPEQAKSVLTNVLQAYEGRGVPNQDEITAFQQALNSYETQNATTTTQNPDGTVTTKEGVGVLSAAARNQFAQDWLIKNEGGQVANSQAATSYYQAAMNALHAPVSVGSNG